jgi:phosphoglycolate phosphatase-like HAD superfamily hydrolase
MSERVRCALFDIDGTLVSMRGAGSRSMDRAFERLTGIPDAFRDVPMAGRTDRAILETALERLAAAGRGPVLAESFHAEFTTGYFEELETEAMKPGPTVCPGVLATLDHLERREVVLGLGTGNYAGAARIKLARFGLWSRFPFGGFGDETRDRPEVVVRAAREGMRRSGATPAEVVVIGDTRADIEAARAVGARVLAVATGPIPAAELAAGRPDHLVPTLLDALRDGFWD